MEVRLAELSSGLALLSVPQFRLALLCVAQFSLALLGVAQLSLAQLCVHWNNNTKKLNGEMDYNALPYLS